MMTGEEKLKLRRKVARANMSADRDYEKSLAPRLRYLICSTQRTGSTLLSDMLENTGVAGCPLEYFNDVYIQVHCRDKGIRQLNRQDYVNEIERRRTSPNGVFGVKAHLQQLRLWFKGAPPGALPAFLRSFDGLVFIRRRDKLGQAVSLYRALLSGRWTSQHAALAASEEPPPAFDAMAITASLHEVLESENAWQKVFAALSLNPHEVFYEDLAADPPAILEGVFAALGIAERPANWPSPALRKQSDGRSHELREKYLHFLKTSGDTSLGGENRPQRVRSVGNTLN